MNEVERNTVLIELLQKLLNQNDYKSITLIRELLKDDTPAMKKSFEIVTSGRLNELMLLINGHENKSI